MVLCIYIFNNNIQKKYVEWSGEFHTNYCLSCIIGCEDLAILANVY